MKRGGGQSLQHLGEFLGNKSQLQNVMFEVSEKEEEIRADRKNLGLSFQPHAKRHSEADTDDREQRLTPVPART